MRPTCEGSAHRRPPSVCRVQLPGRRCRARNLPGSPGWDGASAQHRPPVTGLLWSPAGPAELVTAVSPDGVSFPPREFPWRSLLLVEGPPSLAFSVLHLKVTRTCRRQTSAPPPLLGRQSDSVLPSLAGPLAALLRLPTATCPRSLRLPAHVSVPAAAAVPACWQRASSPVSMVDVTAQLSEGTVLRWRVKRRAVAARWMSVCLRPDCLLTFFFLWLASVLSCYS